MPGSSLEADWRYLCFAGFSGCIDTFMKRNNPEKAHCRPDQITNTESYVYCAKVYGWFVCVCVCVCSDAIFKPILIKFHLIFLVLSRFHWGHVELKCRFSRLCFISTLAITFHISHLSFLCHYFPAGSKRLEEEVKDGRLYITAEQAGCGESVAEITKLLAALSHVVILLSSVFMAFASFLPSTAASKPVLTRLPAIHLCGRFDQLSYLWNSLLVCSLTASQQSLAGRWGCV